MPFITLPDALPDGVEGGTIDTPLGPARWARLSGEFGSLPADWSQLLPWNDGILAWNGYFSHLLTTEDGANWTTVDSDGLHGHMVQAGDDWLLVDGERVLIAADPTGDWTELDTTALNEARLPGWKVEHAYSDPECVTRFYPSCWDYGGE